MKCPKCGMPTIESSSVPSHDSVKRYRLCDGCNISFSTTETINGISAKDEIKSVASRLITMAEHLLYEAGELKKIIESNEGNH